MNYTLLITILRIMGYGELAKAIHKKQPKQDNTPIVKREGPITNKSPLHKQLNAFNWSRNLSYSLVDDAHIAHMKLIEMSNNNEIL